MSVIPQDKEINLNLFLDVGVHFLAELYCFDCWCVKGKRTVLWYYGCYRVLLKI